MLMGSRIIFRRSKKRSKDDEWRLLGVDTESSLHVNQRQVAALGRRTEQSLVHRRDADSKVHQQRRGLSARRHTSENLADESGPKSEVPSAQESEKSQCCRRVRSASEPPLTPFATTSEKLCPADRARMAFPPGTVSEPSRPGSCVVNHDPVVVAATSDQLKEADMLLTPKERTSLRSLLTDVCSVHHHQNAMQREQRRSHRTKVSMETTRQKHSYEAEDAMEGSSNINFPRSIEVLMTVNHSYGLQQTFAKDGFRSGTSNISVTGQSKDIIAISKSKLIMVSTLLLFIIALCFAITIYSYSGTHGNGLSLGNGSASTSVHKAGRSNVSTGRWKGLSTGSPKENKTTQIPLIRLNSHVLPADSAQRRRIVVESSSGRRN
ncbi:uncharacterized protein LOC135391436 isoform X2 [Ornithodoros turicata]|uniref:uncharacterized protein LOC135391436 isoform X2 n=1 Tax=Ornithodoros turicata TaxID=34597 RepID=UPI003138683B